jgi:hypothetical protein
MLPNYSNCNSFSASKTLFFAILTALFVILAIFCILFWRRCKEKHRKRLEAIYALAGRKAPKKGRVHKKFPLFIGFQYFTFLEPKPIHGRFTKISW